MGNTGRKPKQPGVLSTRNLKLIDMVVNEGMPIARAAAKLGISVSTARGVMNRDETQTIIRDKTKQVLRKAAVKAASRLAEQLDSDNPWVVQNAASRILGMVDQDEQREKDGSVVVNFSMNMPKPGMPESVTDGSDAVISAEGQVT